jgi:hypothetical protein
MKYETPRVTRLAPALEAIQGNCPKAGPKIDSEPTRCGGVQPHTDGSAYEADE